MAPVIFRFHGLLERFLPAARRGCAFASPCAPQLMAKHQIETLGVPHTEVAVLLVNGESSDLARRLQAGDRVQVYPAGHIALGDPARITTQPPGRPRFVADAHLGALARRLRLAGFDTLFDNAYADPALAALAAREDRILLTRDRELLKRRLVTYGCYVHALHPAAQLQELYQRLELAPWAQPFSRCLACNTRLERVAAEAVAARIPPRVREYHQRFLWCADCDQVFWEGGHWQALRRQLAPWH